jgi:hypothetical protein
MPSPILDLLLSYKFTKILSTPWRQMDAFKLGIIDENGKILKPLSTLKTAQEKKAYPSVFYTLMWNIKRLIDLNSPCLLGKGIHIANKPEVVIRAFMLKEWCEKDVSDPDLIEKLVSDELYRRGIDPMAINEDAIPIAIEAGHYIIRGRKVVVEKQLLPTDRFFGYPIFRIGSMSFTIHDVKEDAPANAVGNAGGGGHIAGASPGEEPPGRKGILFRKPKRRIRR